jgi:hypothetical protein
MMRGVNPGQRLADLVAAATNADGRAWLESARAAVAIARDGDGDVVDALLTLSPATGRELGRVTLTDGDDTLATADGPSNLRAWTVADAGRALLILDALHGDIDVVTPLYRAGDEGERMSVTRALSLFGGGERWKPLALETGRVNSTTLFASLALDNPYPAARYTEQEFNQLVLKALFVGLPLARVVGLAARANAELSRMCEDYIGERTAAGRPVPEDIGLALLRAPGDPSR